jgi:hypothetical protein
MSDLELRFSRFSGALMTCHRSVSTLPHIEAERRENIATRETGAEKKLLRANFQSPISIGNLLNGCLMGVSRTTWGI